MLLKSEIIGFLIESKFPSVLGRIACPEVAIMHWSSSHNQQFVAHLWDTRFVEDLCFLSCHTQGGTSCMSVLWSMAVCACLSYTHGQPG